MKKWRVIVDVERATGSQSYIVEAESPEDAIKRCEAGEGEFECEDISVDSVHYPSPREVKEVEDSDL